MSKQTVRFAQNFLLNAVITLIKLFAMKFSVENFTDFYRSDTKHRKLYKCFITYQAAERKKKTKNKTSSDILFLLANIIIEGP